MKVKHYIYSDNRKANLELKEWFAENFENPEAIETSVADGQIIFEAKEGQVVIPFVEITNPLVVDEHVFEELVEYHVEYSIEDKVFSSKIVNLPWSQKRIAEVALVHYATAKTRVSRQPVAKINSKVREERELLKALKAQKTLKTTTESSEIASKKSNKASKNIEPNNEF